MKRARTRLQSRLRPIKSYEYGGDIDPSWDGGGGDLPAMPEGSTALGATRLDTGPYTDIERDRLSDYEGQINRNALRTKIDDLTSEAEQVGRLRRRYQP